MANRPPVSSLHKASFRFGDVSRSIGRPRRRPELTRLLPADPPPAGPAAASGFEPAQQILRSILCSASDLVGADQCFFLVSRNDAVLEVASARNIRPADIMQVVLGRGAPVIGQCLRERRLACGDANGRPMPLLDGVFEANSPALLCLPLDLGLSQAGVLCLLRRRRARRVSELDLEILQALTEQAALAIGAASHQTALTRLEASLSALTPSLA